MVWLYIQLVLLFRFKVNEICIGLRMTLIVIFNRMEYCLVNG